MRAALIGAFLLTLSGCGSAPPKPETVTVEVPVAVNCVAAMPARPFYETEQLGPAATDLQFGDALAVDWVLSRGYEKKLEAAVMACLVR